jgi:hypothetical protein
MPSPAERVAEYVRDVPQSCICLWQWSRSWQHWTLDTVVYGCPWHEGGK